MKRLILIASIPASFALTSYIGVLFVWGLREMISRLFGGVREDGHWINGAVMLGLGSGIGAAAVAGVWVTEQFYRARQK